MARRKQRHPVVQVRIPSQYRVYQVTDGSLGRSPHPLRNLGKCVEVVVDDCLPCN